MNKDLTHYIQKVQLLSHGKADSIVSKLDGWVDFDFYGGQNICVNEYPAIPYQVTDHNDDELSDIVGVAVDEYIQEYLSDAPWFSYWNGLTKFNFVRYPEGSDGMATHADHVRNVFNVAEGARGIPTLTVICSLNDGYEGGDIEICEDIIITLKKGEAIIFPSIFLFPHKVMPITKGFRISTSVWVW